MIAKLLRAGRHPVLLSTAAILFASLGAVEPVNAQLTPQDRGYVGYSYLQIPDVAGDWRGAPYRGWIGVNAHYWQVARPGATTAFFNGPRTVQAPGQRAPQAAPAAGGAAANAPAPAQSSLSGQEVYAQRLAQASQANRGAQQQQQGQQGQQQARAQSPFGRGAIAQVPGAPRSGEGTLIISIAKDNPTLPALMERCHSQAIMPEVNYSVSSRRSRKFPEFGPLPAGMPDYFDYRLRDVQFVDCPVVADAPEQAIVVHFGNIDWLNWQNEARSMPVTFQPAELAPLPRNLTGETRAWVLTWMAMANDVSADQCPTMNARPTEADFYALATPEQAERERAELAGQGGPNYENGQMGMRGPHRLNVTMLPGIVADPGHAEPQTRIARGLNLDGSTSSRQHRNYVSEDGQVTGIDNQLYTVMGCIAGWQGHNGFILQFANNQMRDGQMSILVEVNGIDNERNDNEVYVNMLYSTEAMAKSGSGTSILPDFTFHVTDSAQYTQYFSRVRGRIVNGVILTEPVNRFALNLGVYGNPPELNLANARMRLELQPNGNLRGVVGGYRDWREISSTYVSSTTEFYHGFQQPALYNSLRRNADGLRNPVTGEYDGISTAYDMEGVPAFVVHRASAIAQTNQSGGGAN